MNNVAEHLPEDPNDFELMSWLESGTIGRVEVVTYHDHEAGKRLGAIEAELEELGYSEDDKPDALPTDGPLDESDVDEDRVRELLEEKDAVTERLAASKAVWTVRAISAEEVEAAHDKHQVPKIPVQPQGPNVSEQVQKKFQDRAVAYGKAKSAYDLSVRLEMIHTAVESVKTSAGEQAGISVDALRRMRSLPHGEGWIDRLFKAVNEATDDDIDIPRPTLRG